MTVTSPSPKSGLATRLVNGLLSIKPLAEFAKSRARNMMIQRAEKLGIPWRDKVQRLRVHDWNSKLAALQNAHVTYPEYYLTSFHAYDQGNLCWDAALEVECAAYAVHAKIWPELGSKGDQRLRETYHEILTKQLPLQPEKIIDLGCGVGMSTLSLQATYPQAKMTGVDLSPYYLAVAEYRCQPYQKDVCWVHNAAESTGLSEESYDLVSACLMFHELPQQAAKEIFAEAYRLLRPGGYFSIMDMNPGSEIIAKMPPYVFTLLKSTEPYLDDYFSLDVEKSLMDKGFATPSITPNSPRHRTIIAQKKR